MRQWRQDCGPDQLESTAMIRVRLDGARPKVAVEGKAVIWISNGPTIADKKVRS